jgi:hypothetical protein
VVRIACAKRGPLTSGAAVHAFLLEGSGRILNQGDVVAKLHGKASGGFDAGVRDKTDENDFLDPALCE